jgi:acyl dehydratase
MLALYARALARELPVIGGGGGDGLPERVVERTGVEADPEHLAAYDRVCGFRLRDELPPTFAHVLAFDLALALMTDRSFPFGVMGLVHVRNRIVAHRPLRLGEPLHLRVRAQNLAAQPKGRTVDVVAEARVDGELAWEDVSTYLHREAGSGAEPRRTEPDPFAALPARARWTVGGDAGRRYAAVSGDRNPIHLHPLSAKLFGLPGPIAHGMWVKARCLAALENTLPASYAVDVRFRLPLPLPSRVTFAAGDGGRFAVRAARDGRPHLEGSVTTL